MIDGHYAKGHKKSEKKKEKNETVITCATIQWEDPPLLQTLEIVYIMYFHLCVSSKEKKQTRNKKKLFRSLKKIFRFFNGYFPPAAGCSLDVPSVCVFFPVTASMFFAVAVFCAKILKILFKKKKEENRTKDRAEKQRDKKKKETKQERRSFVGVQLLVDCVSHQGREKKVSFRIFESISFVTMPLNLQKILSSAQICSIFLYDTKKNASGGSYNNISVYTGMSQVTAAMSRRASANQNPEERKKKHPKNF